MQAPFGRSAAAFSSYLIPRRLRFGFIIAGAMWLSWTLSVLLGPGHFDLAGQSVGTDFAQYYSAGRTVAGGNSAHIYDQAYQQELEREILGPELEGFYAFVNPPFFAWVFAPLSYLPYELAFAVWSALGLAAIMVAMRATGLPARKTLPWTLTFFPVFAAISFGQNSLLSLVLLALTYAAWKAKRLVLAGLVLSLLLYKPQLVLGVLLLWGLGWKRDWRSLVGFGTGAVALAGGSFLFMPEASAAYVEFSRTTLPHLMTWGGAALWHMHTVRGFFQLLLPHADPVATALAGVVSAAAVALFVQFWRSRKDRPELVFAAAVVLTMLITPHAMVYEWAILLIPAALLWKAMPDDRPLLRAVFATLWLTMLVSTPIMKFQLAHLPFAIQPSLPILIVCIALLRQQLLSGPAEQRSPTPEKSPRTRVSKGQTLGTR